MPPKALDASDFDAIRDAVMETPRGRWFLEQYAARLRSAETTGLAASLKRLEAAVAANHDSLMARLAAALAEEPAEDMPEGPAAADADAGPAPGLAPRHMKYFRPDEALFEPAPEATIAAVPPLMAAVPEQEQPPAKRRIVIIRHKPGEQIDVPLADEFAKAS